MPETGDDLEADPEARAARAEQGKAAWQGTLDDMEGMAEAREGEGWDVVTVTALDGAPKSSEKDDRDRHGLVFVVPDNQAEPLEAAIDAGEFPRFDVYRAEQTGEVYLVVEYLDPETETAVLVAGTYELRYAAGMVKEGREAGETYTHYQTLDTTPVGSFRHEGANAVEKFVPHADDLDNYVREINTASKEPPEDQTAEDYSDLDPDEQD
jgi:hypothetical protein